MIDGGVDATGVMGKSQTSLRASQTNNKASKSLLQAL
jgi:hypothetical protein